MNKAELLENLRGCKNALIVGHSHPDGDCVGSAVALACLIEAMGNKAAVIFPEKAPKRLEFLFSGREELSLLPSDLENYEIICVDLASPQQMASLRESIEDKVLYRIDHHDKDVPYAKNEYVEASAAAAGEIIFDLYEEALARGYVKELSLPAKTALFGAISSDTGCFKYQNTSGATHIRAAKLIEMGTPAHEINKLLFDTKDELQLRAEGIATRGLKTFCGGKISTIAIEESDYTDGLTISEFETAVDIARSLRGAVVAAVAKAAPAKGAFRCSLRANGDIDVSRIAAVFDGGGHIRAAGCTIMADSAKEAISLLVAEIEKVI